MNGSNLPPGTWEGDPRAPWNQPDEDEEEVEEIDPEDIEYLRAENSAEWEERHGGGL